MSRRHLLVTGTSLGAAAVLFGCDSSEPEAEVGVVQPENGAAGGANTNSGAMYDGAPVEPLSDAPIMNPEGFADRPIGGVNADATVIEYLSPTCPHCANFNATVFPQIRENYIENGAITWISRPFMRNVLDAVIFMLAEEAGSGEAYYDMLDTFMQTQNEWATAENPRQAIFEVAQQYGFTQERFEEILTDQDMFGALESLRDQAMNEFNVTGTPTFFINGEQHNGNTSYESLSQAIDEQL